jgi:hypothetical protein
MSRLAGATLGSAGARRACPKQGAGSDALPLAPGRRRVLLLALAEWLCANYDSDDRAKELMDRVHLYLMPSMNPDGFAANRRENS